MIMGAIVWLSIGNSLETDALRRSADRLRAGLAEARYKAMQSGVIQAFRYEAETGTFIIEPFQDEYSEVDAADVNSLQMAGQSTYEKMSDDPNAQELFEPVIFAAIEAETTGSRASRLFATAGSEEIVFFYPDGTATGAVVRIQIGTQEGGDDTYIEVTVNGLTGLTTKTDLVYPGELSSDTR